jgi:hypothetical protein
MIQQVLQAIQQAFAPSQAESHLQEAGGRVFGSVKVIGSQTFDSLDDARRQERLWTYLRQILGPESVRVGPVILEPTKRG